MNNGARESTLKITFIGHASILIESNNLRILSDPWWAGPCFGAQWWLYPKPYLSPIRENRIDYIYISHGHNDHFHPGTLAGLSRSSKVLVSSHLDLAAPIRQLGFPVLEVSRDQEMELDNGVKCRIMPTHNDDTLMATSDGHETCINLNDALHAAPETVQNHFVSLLKRLYPWLDYVFCGYGKASHFPDCYFIANKDGPATAARRQRYFNGSWARIVHGLQPKFAFPFAADVVLLENELFPLNEAVHNSERPTDHFLKAYGRSSTQVIDIAPGFVIEDGVIRQHQVRQAVSNELLQSEYKAEIEKANYYGRVEPEEVRELTELVKQNVDLCSAYLRTFPEDYRCLIKLRNASHSIEINKRGEQISVFMISTDRAIKTDYDLVYTTRASYLKKSLTTPYGNEILFVGSGGIFEYINRSKLRSALHREIVAIVKKQERCPQPRYGPSGRFVFGAKMVVKKMLRLMPEDLYDLEKWTVYRNVQRSPQ